MTTPLSSVFDERALETSIEKRVKDIVAEELARRRARLQEAPRRIRLVKAEDVLAKLHLRSRSHLDEIERRGDLPRRRQVGSGNVVRWIDLELEGLDPTEHPTSKAKIITRRQLADKLAVSDGYLRRLIDAGEIPGPDAPAKNWYEAKIDEWIADLPTGIGGAPVGKGPTGPKRHEPARCNEPGRKLPSRSYPDD